MNKELIEQIAQIQPSPVHQHICIGSSTAEYIGTICFKSFKSELKEKVLNLKATKHNRRVFLQMIEELE